MTPRKILLGGLAGGWIFLLAAYVFYYAPGLTANRAMVLAAPGEIARFESGEPAYYDLLARAPAYEPGQHLLLLSADNLGQAEFLSYRACYQLYPIRPLYIPINFIPPAEPRFSLNPDPNLLVILKEKNVSVCALFVRTDPRRSAYYRIRLESAGKMTLVRLLEKPAPPLPGPVRAWKWLVGLGLTALLGAGFCRLSGIFSAVRGGWATGSALSLYSGAGITAWLMVSFGVLRVPLSVPAVLAGWAAVLAGAGAMWYRARRAVAAPVLPAPVVAEVPVPAAVPAGKMSGMDKTGVILAISGLCWALIAVAVPMSAWGNWDTWAIWNLKAKACWLARGIPFAMLGEQVYKFSHHDYPLGLPMLHSWLASWAGGMDERLLRLLSPVYLLTLFLLLAGLLKELGMSRGRWLVAAAFITIPKVLTQGYSGYADLPVSCGMVAVLLLLVRAYRGEPVGWAVGVFGGITALHKDEGLIWAGSSIMLLAAWAWRGKVRRPQVFIAALLLAVVAGPWKGTAASLGLRPNDYKIDPVRMVEDATDRIPLVMRAVVLETVGPGVSMQGIAGMETPPGQWWLQLRGSWFLMWYAVLLWAFMGFRRWWKDPLFAWLGFLPLVQGCAYTAVYTASVAASLPWHITTSLDRLLLQVAPSIFALAAASCFGLLPGDQVPAMPGGKGRPGKAQMRK